MVYTPQYLCESSESPSCANLVSQVDFARECVHRDMNQQQRELEKLLGF